MSLDVLQVGLSFGQAAAPIGTRVGVMLNIVIVLLAAFGLLLLLTLLRWSLRRSGSSPRRRSGVQKSPWQIAGSRAHPHDGSASFMYGGAGSSDRDWHGSNDTGGSDAGGGDGGGGGGSDGGGGGGGGD